MFHLDNFLTAKLLITLICTVILSITVQVFRYALSISTHKLITLTLYSLLAHLLTLITTIRTVSVSITSPAAVNTKVLLQALKLLCFAHFCFVSSSFITAVYFIQAIRTVWVEIKGSENECITLEEQGRT